MTPERDAELRAVVERQLEIERKAAAWDEWRRRVEKTRGNIFVTWEGTPLAELLDALECAVPPAGREAHA